MKKINFILLILITFVISISLYFLIFKIVYPAYISTQIDCLNKTYKNYVIAGQYVFVNDTKNNISKEEIIIYKENIKDEKEELKTMRHEFIHYTQRQENRLCNCIDVWFNFCRFVNEAEAYIFEYFSIYDTEMKIYYEDENKIKKRN